MVRWLIIAAVVWLTVLTVLTLIAIFRHSTSHHSGTPQLIAVR
jgi:hypothetical protein